MAKLHRVEYPISGQYCRNWKTVEALREIIANMLDARAEYTCRWQDGTGFFTDGGAGFGASCLMLGEGEVKDGEQIGQFREGLKLALLTLARDSRRVALETTEFAVRSASMEMTGLGKEGLVLYVDHGHTQVKGTEVRVECTEKEFNSAQSMFLQLREAVEPIYTDGDDNQVFNLFPKQKAGGIFVNGLLTDSNGRWAWNYNLLGPQIKGAMNRDRSVLARRDVNEAVGRLWLGCTDTALATEFIDKTREKNCAEVAAFNSAHWYRISEHWQTVVAATLKTQWEKLVIDDGRVHMVRECREHGFLPIQPTVALGPAVGAVTSQCLVTATQRMQAVKREAEKRARRKQKKSSKRLGPYEIVNLKKLPEHLLNRLNSAASVVRRAAEVVFPCAPSWVQDPEYFVYTVDHTEMESQGVAYEGKVGISYGYLNREHLPEENLVGVILHEMLHLRNRLNIDCTREFENALTDAVGALAVRVGESGTLDAVDVTYSPRSRKRIKTRLVALDELELTTADLGVAIKSSIECATKAGAKETYVDWGKEHDKTRASESLWRYLGYVATDSRARGSSTAETVYVFMAQDTKGEPRWLGVSVADTTVKRGSRRRIKVSYAWSPTRVRRLLGYYVDQLVTFKECPLSQAWPELGELIDRDVVPLPIAAKKGGNERDDHEVGDADVDGTISGDDHEHRRKLD